MVGVVAVTLIGAVPAPFPLTTSETSGDAPSPETLLELSADLRRGELADTVASFEDLIGQDHLWYGQTFHAFYSTADQVPGDVVELEGHRDVALWSGVYLAGEAFRYGVVKHQAETARNHGQAVSVANELRRIRDRIELLVASAHLRINIARNWKADGSTNPEGPDYRAGVADGRAGMLMRNCFPEGVPEWQQVQDATRRGRQVFGPLTWDGAIMPWEDPDGPRPRYYCEDDTSRDAYIGTLLGLVTTLDIVGPDDRAMQEQIRDDLYAMAGYHVTTQGWMIYPYMWTPDPVETGEFPRGLDPLFVHGPQPRLHLMQAARHAAQVAGSELDRVAWEAIWAKNYAEFGPNYVNEQLLGLQDPNSCYFCHNLNHINAFDLIRLERDPLTRQNFREGLAVEDSMAGDDGNAWFEAIVYALTGDPQRLELSVQHLHDWLEYRANSNYGTFNSQRCGVDLECVPADTVEYYIDTPTGEVSHTVDGSSTALRARYPLPIAERSPADFLWQDRPTKLDQAKDPRHRRVGSDLTTPYWMLRYFTEVAPPTYDPLPDWAGPSSR